MTYPIVPIESAATLLDLHLRDELTDSEVAAVTKEVGSVTFDKDTVSSLNEGLWNIANEEESKGNKFERRACALVHETLNLHPIVAGDPGFWRWLTFSNDGYLADLIDWRYGGEEPGVAKSQYFGLGKIKAGMYGYLWLCADAVVDLTREDPYELSYRGDVDVWQSHIIRVDFGSVPNLASAFIEFVFPADRSNPLKRGEWRELAKEITRRNASMSFEILDDKATLNFVQRIWDERQQWMSTEIA